MSRFQYLITLTTLVFSLGNFSMPLNAQFELDTVLLTNPSFEDEPRNSVPPWGWIDCGFRGETPPDVHPIYPPSEGWRVTMAAQDGKTYMGMVVRDNDTWERVSQPINGTLQKGKCYEFSIWLARSPSYVSLSHMTGQPTNYTTPTVLRIWGGESLCDRSSLLAESAAVRNHSWEEYHFQFNPSSDYEFIMLEVYYETPVLFPYNGNLLLDNSSPIIRIPCNETEMLEMEKLLTETTAEEDVLAVNPPQTQSTSVAANEPEVKSDQSKDKQNINPIERTGPPVRSLGGIHRSKLKEGQVIQINRLYFDADTFHIRSESYENLDQIAYFLIDNPEVSVEIGGHTNDLPSEDYCYRLSKSRARAVTKYLISKGVDPDRLTYKGYGKSQPIATNRTAAGRSMNQRVEIKILRTGE
ncbi:MAG: OmpA family protein [Saprospirales bacterium]|nr:MAG: OmpA family protein [Saprospirales bacterium]